MSRRDSATTFLRPAERGHTGYAARLAPHTTVHWFTWRHAGLGLEVRFKLSDIRDPRWKGWVILHLEPIAARDTPVPVTPTAFLQHGIDAHELAAAGGPVAYMTAWLDRDADRPAFRKAVHRWRQGDLFDFVGMEEKGP